MSLRKVSVFLLFVIPTVILVSLIAIRKSEPNQASLMVPAGKSVPAYIDIENSWKTNHFGRIDILNESSLSQEIGDLVIDSHSGGITKDMVAAFRASVVKTLMSFKATEFNDYLELAAMDESSAFDTNLVKGFSETIAQSYGRAPATAKAVIEAWWQTNSWRGTWAAKACQGICWRKSFLRFGTIGTTNELDAREFNTSLIKSVENCGIISTDSVFTYSPAPEEVLSLSQRLFVADAYLLFEFEFEKEITAAPVVLRYYWAPSRHKWLPWRLACGYQGVVPYPIF